MAVGQGQEVTFSVPAERTKLDDILGFIERTTIEKALREHGYVQVKAASALGLSESALRYKMRKYGIKS
jgi:transcriptional regulator with GAF, ATPase, and Fis domain